LLPIHTTQEFGTKNTLDYRCYIKDSTGKVVSPFHDIPCWHDQAAGVVNMVCEVSRWTNAKMEVSKELEFNPILQDSKKGKARFVHNCFPHKGYIWNYGCIPQTWEHPEVQDSHTNQNGDNDPIDICDIGEKISTVGEVKQVKVLGIMALIDEGETDWKVIGIDVTDPLAEKMNDISDVDKFMPGTIVATNEWFRIYKMPAGKPENEFAFKGAAKDKEFAKQIINETGEQWKTMQFGEGYKDLASVNSTQEGSKDYTPGPEKAGELLAKEPAATADAPLDPSVHKWHYITL
jgi:inorganic pyrophosphatase